MIRRENNVHSSMINTKEYFPKSRTSLDRLVKQVRFPTASKSMDSPLFSVRAKISLFVNNPFLI